MKSKLIFAFLIAVLLARTAAPAFAQAPRIELLDSTIPLGDDIRAAVVQALEMDPPHSTPYYMITHAAKQGAWWYVSLSGHELASPADEPNVEINGVWFGTLRIQFPLSELLGPPTVEQWYGWANPAKTQKPRPAPGGGPEILLPFSLGTSAIYGTRGVHAAWGEGTALAVDFVGSTDGGINIMGPQVYSSYYGMPTWICEDDYSKAVLLYNEDTNDKFYYLHLNLQTTLAYGVQYMPGTYIGDLAFGNIPATAECGWAEQQPNAYHIHWGFEPQDGGFTAENWTLSIAEETWSNGSTDVEVGGLIQRSGSPGGNGNGNGTTNTSSVGIINFWDFIIGAVYSLANFIAAQLSPHERTAIFIGIISGASLAIRLFYVIGASMLDLRLFAIIVMVILLLESGRLFFSVIKLALTIAKIFL